MQLRWYQDEALWSAYEHLSTKTDDPVIALPTGTGKSLVIAEFMRRTMQAWPSQRMLATVHVKELVDQNYKTLLRIWPSAPAGIYSAGLKQRDTALPMVFGGIASMYKRAEEFGHRDLMFIDECHLTSPDDDTMQRMFIDDLRKINPRMRLVGLSATPWRMGQGRITDGGIFGTVCYDMTTYDNFNRLIADGFIAPLIPKKTNVKLDVSKVSMRNGEFAAGALQSAVDRQDITYAALQETMIYGADRRCWLVFASGIEHADHVASMLNMFGVPAAAVTSKTKNRDEILDRYRRGELRAIVNNNVLTTGFDWPPIDLIVMLRPTMSTGLWVQMLGRGTRPSPETFKTNCLVLDFAGNTQRLGPINDPVIPKKKGEGTGDVPIKICDACGAYNHARAKVCISCGAEFQFETKITGTASTDELIKSDLPIVQYFDVDRVLYNRHDKQGSPSLIRVSYFCGMRKFNEYVCLEHSGYAAKRARDWWRQRYSMEPPLTTNEALQHVSQLRTPRRLRVWINKPHPEVLSCEF